MSSIKSRTAAWLKGHVPTRESLEKNRWLKPFSKNILRSELWRFNRRSVPRGMALGLFVGIMIPLAHFVVAAIIAVFVRANIPVAMAATFIGFPAIYVFIAAAAYKLGPWLLHIDKMTGVAPITETMNRTEFDHVLQMVTSKGLPTAFGLFVIATVTASVGYLLTSLVWRFMVAHKWRSRIGAVRRKPPLQ